MLGDVTATALVGTLGNGAHKPWVWYGQNGQKIPAQHVLFRHHALYRLSLIENTGKHALGQPPLTLTD